MSDALTDQRRAWYEETRRAIEQEETERAALALRLRRSELRLAELRARQEILEIDLALTTVTAALPAVPVAPVAAAARRHAGGAA